MRLIQLIENSKMIKKHLLSKPQLIFDSKELIEITSFIISNFNINLIARPEVRIMTQAVLQGINKKLQNLLLNYYPGKKSCKLNLKLPELAALRICFVGADVKSNAYQDPFLWIIYTQIMNDNAKFIL